jgi:hypothetical protein
MKKIIILTIAVLSTGIVLSNSLKKTEVVIKPIAIEVQKNTVDKNADKTPSFDAVATAD